MNYNIEMQSAGLIFLLIILISFIFSKKRNSIEFKIFPLHILIGVFTLIFDIASCITIPHMDKIPVLTTVIGKIYLCFLYLYICFSFVYAILCSMNSSVSTKKHKIAVFAILASAILYFAFVVIAIFSKIHFFCSGRLVYSYGTLPSICYIFTAATITGTIIYLLLNRNSITINARIPIWTFVLAELIPAIIQFFNPEILVVGFAVSVCEYTLFRSLENSRNEDEQNEIIKAFAEIIEGRDENTGEHVKRTIAYVSIILEKLRENKKYKKILTKEYTDTLTYASSLHDVGKISIPDSVLQKPGPFSKEERAIIETHPLKGYALIRDSFDKIGSRLFKRIALELTLFHHEKWDGSGYPKGLKWDQIPLSAQIMSVADVFDAVSQDRCYRPPMSLSRSFEIIQEGIGTHFSPDIARAFLESRELVEQTYYNFAKNEKSENKDSTDKD